MKHLKYAAKSKACYMGGEQGNQAPIYVWQKPAACFQLIQDAPVFQRPLTVWIDNKLLISASQN